MTFTKLVVACAFRDRIRTLGLEVWACSSKTADSDVLAVRFDTKIETNRYSNYTAEA